MTNRNPLVDAKLVRKATENSTETTTGDKATLDITYNLTDNSDERHFTNLWITSVKLPGDPSYGRTLDLVTTSTDLTVDQGYHSEHTVTGDEGHAKDGKYNAHHNRTKVHQVSDTLWQLAVGDGQTDFWHSGSTSTTTNNRQEEGTYRDELQESGDYQRTGEGTFTLIDRIHTVEVEGMDPFSHEYWKFDEEGALVEHERRENKTDSDETTTTKGSYSGGELTQTQSKSETNTGLSRVDAEYEYALDTDPVGEFSGWAKDHWRLDNVTTTAPNKETGLIETTARKTERIWGTKTDANATPPISFRAGPDPQQQNTTDVPFEHTNYLETVSLIDGNGDALLEFDKSVTIDPLNDPPPSRPVPTYEQLVAMGITVPAGSEDSWWWAGAKGLGTGGKAVFNGGSNAVANFVTLGGLIGDPSKNPVKFQFSDYEKSIGAETAEGFASVSGEILVGLSTGGASHYGKVGKGIAVADAVGNAYVGAQAANNIRQEGLNAGNALQLGGSLLGAAGQYSSRRLGNQIDNAFKKLDDIELDDAARGGRHAEPLSPSNYPNPDPAMSVPPVRYTPKEIDEVIRMRQGKGPTTKTTHGSRNIEAHHRQQRSVDNNQGLLDELEMSSHRGPGNHSRHNLPSELTPAQRAKEIREHWRARGNEYVLPGEGI